MSHDSCLHCKRIATHMLNLQFISYYLPINYQNYLKYTIIGYLNDAIAPKNQARVVQNNKKNYCFTIVYNTIV